MYDVELGATWGRKNTEGIRGKDAEDAQMELAGDSIGHNLLEREGVEQKRMQSKVHVGKMEY